MFKVIILNIRNQTGTLISQALENPALQDADLVIFTGCREAGFYKTGALIRVKYKSAVFMEPAPDWDGILIISKSNLGQLSGNDYKYDPWFEVGLPEKNLTILGFHLPDTLNFRGNEETWGRLGEYIQKNNDTRVMIVGSLIMAPGNWETVFSYKRHLRQFAASGWVDARRYLHPVTYESLWFGQAKKGFRLELAILSPLLREFLSNAYQLPVLPISKRAGSTSAAVTIEFAGLSGGDF